MGRNRRVLTTYFTSKKDPQRGDFKDNNADSRVCPFIPSAEKHGLNVIIFNDALSEQFKDKWGSNLIEFCNIPLEEVSGSSYSVNDLRYFIWKDYIESNSEIEEILLVDLFDVEFWGNPFELIEQMPDIKIFTGGTNNENLIGKKGHIRAKMRAKYGKVYFGDKMAVGAGTIMGRREPMLTLLNRMVEDFKAPLKGKPTKMRNYNMGVFNHALYDLFSDEELLVGYPFTSRFGKREEWDEDNNRFYLKHK